MGLSLSDWVVTEAGFGADLGAEKFFDIKCVAGGLAPKAVVVVATIRALRHHGGAQADAYNTPNLEAVKEGFANLQKHLENVKKFGIPPVVAINSFHSDTQEEVTFVQAACAALGVTAVKSEGWAKGGAGTQDLARAVVEAASRESHFKPLYETTATIREKIATIATEIYGAEGVDYSKQAEIDLRKITALGVEHLPVCMAKTQKSLSDNEALRGVPKGFRVTVREFELALGAGFVIPILGNMMRMPGLPAVPASEGMDIDENGVISGLS
jgi:formate--tetrahydrofolate ligase